MWVNFFEKGIRKVTNQSWFLNNSKHKKLMTKMLDIKKTQSRIQFIYQNICLRIRTWDQLFRILSDRQKSKQTFLYYEIDQQLQITAFDFSQL